MRRSLIARHRQALADGELQERVMELARRGLSFVVVGDLAGKIRASTARIIWERLATAADVGTREAAELATKARAWPKPEPGAQERLLASPQRFDDPEATIATDAVGRLSRAEPFGFSLYGGTLV